MTMLAPAVILVTLVASALSLKWTAVHDGTGTAPSPRRDPALGYDIQGNVLVVFGGRESDKTYLNDTWLYDIATGTWSELSVTIAPSARRSVVYASDQDRLYVATGEMKKSQANDVWQFDFRSRTWSQLEQRPCEPDGPVPEPRYGAAGGLFSGSNRLYVSLGFGKVRYFDTYIYKLDQKCWHIVTPGPHNLYNPSYPHARCLHGGAMTGEDQLVIFGGCLGAGGVGGACPSGDTWQLAKDDSSDDMNWEHLQYCPIPRIYPTMATLPSAGNVQKAVMYGGVYKTPQVLETSEIPANEVAVFDSASKTWTLKRTEEEKTPTRRASAAMVSTADGIFMFGGSSVGKGGHLNDLWQLTGSVDDSPTVDSCNRPFFNLIIVHGILMFMSWGLLLQAGAFIARYLRDQAGHWFKAHLALQIIGIAASIGGLVCAILSVDSLGADHFKLAHGIIGLVVMVVGFLQPVNAVIRPHIKADGVRTTGRKVWEFFHKNLGRGVLILGLVNVSLGLFIGVVRPAIWIAWFVYCGVLVLAYVIAEFCKKRQSHKGNEKISNNKPI